MHKILRRLQSLSQNEKTPLYLLATLLGVIVMLGISVTLLCIYYSKPIGDDFSGIAYYSHSWLSQFTASLSTTGRYGQSVVSAVIYGSFGDHASLFASVLILIWMIALTYVLLRAGAKHIQIKYNYFGLLSLSLAITFLVIFVNKTIETSAPPTWLTYQLFFWPAGIATYTISLLTALTLVYFLFVQKHNLSTKWRLALLAVGVYATGLFNEIQPATFFAICVGLLILSLIPYFSVLKKVRIHLFTTASTSLLALLSLYFSAGSKNRQTYLSTQISHDHLLSNIWNNFTTALIQVYLRPRDLFLIMAVGLLVGLLIAASKKIRSRTLIVIGCIGLFLWIGSLICSLILVAYGYGDTVGLYPRTLLIPQILSVVSLITLAAGIGLFLAHMKSSFFMTIAAVIVFTGVTLFIPKYTEKMTSQLNSSIAYSNTWKYEDQKLKERAAKNPDETIYLPDSATGIGDGFSLRCTAPNSASTIWLNDLIEEYYHVREVCSELDIQGSR